VNNIQKIFLSVLLGAAAFAFGFSMFSSIAENRKKADRLSDTSAVFGFLAILSSAAFIISLVWWGLAWW